MTEMEHIKYEELETRVTGGYCPSCFDHHYVEIKAWRTATKGLIVHRALEYVPSGRANNGCTRGLWKAGEESGWMVTHRRSGFNLLKPSESFSRQKEAFKFAKRMGKHANWTYGSTDSYNEQEGLLAEIYKARTGVLHEMDAELAGLVVYDEDFDPPFFISVERTEGGRLFHVMNKVSGDTAFTFPHRGQAAEKAVELNLEAMV